MQRAGDVYELRFEPREQRGFRVLAAAIMQAVTLADTISGNDTTGAGGAYVLTRRSDGTEVLRVDVTHDEIGGMRLHLEDRLAKLTPEEFMTSWTPDDQPGARS
ncbi:hypothetical protein EXE59_20325 [Nocardioides eburneiflavus]|uniref:Uncharacterized protein n=1 Tax=Nocardioides eburneiflavus TaxID=2518372 RepID=A0A4Z1C6T7_9ACTN|nr:hypothetical protein [Nocardioides eburneiflavus]TGN66034.1 hypothetical protein EXE59_20325 [Nocardioides eburneiflavus]